MWFNRIYNSFLFDRYFDSYIEYELKIQLIRITTKGRIIAKVKPINWSKLKSRINQDKIKANNINGDKIM